MPKGGYREGSGRKPKSFSEDPLVRASFSLPQDCVEWLGQFGRKQGAAITSLIRKEIQKAKEN